MSASETRFPKLDTAISAGLLLAVAFTALAHGAVEPWSVAVFELIVLALGLLWAIKSVADKRIRLTVPAALVPVAALVVFGLAQSVSLTDESGGRASLSVDVEATRSAVTVLFFVLASALIAANFYKTREGVKRLLIFLVVFGLALAVFGLIQHFTWDGRLYWLRPTARREVFGPFVNRNHFAGYMEMLIFIPAALIVTGGVRRDLRLFYGFAAAMMGLATVVSLSRGGMIGMLAGMLFLAAMSYGVRTRDGQTENEAGGRPQISPSAGVAVRAGAVGAIALTIVAGTIWIGADPVIGRLAQTVQQADATSAPDYNRNWIWKDTLSMIAANPLTGVGLGAYQTAYSRYASTNGSLIVAQSHNDYLQVLADGGIIGGALALWFIVALFRGLVRGVRSRDPLLRAAALGGGAGAVAILVHSVFDFNLQLPSNALLFLCIAAVASRAGASSGRPRSISVEPGPHDESADDHVAVVGRAAHTQ